MVSQNVINAQIAYGVRAVPPKKTEPTLSRTSTEIPPVEDRPVLNASKAPDTHTQATPAESAPQGGDPPEYAGFPDLISGLVKPEVESKVILPKQSTPSDIRSSGNISDNKYLRQALIRYVNDQAAGFPGTDSADIDKKTGEIRITPDPKVQTNCNTARIRAHLEKQLAGLSSDEKTTVLSAYDNFVGREQETMVNRMKFESPYRIMMLMHGGPGRKGEMARELETLKAADKYLNAGNLTEGTKGFCEKVEAYLNDGSPANVAAIFQPKIEEALSFGQYDFALRLDSMMRKSLKKSLPGLNGQKEISETLGALGYEHTREEMISGRKVQADLEEILSLASDGNIEKAQQLYNGNGAVRNELTRIINNIPAKITGAITGKEGQDSGGRQLPEITDLKTSETFRSLADTYKLVLDQKEQQGKLAMKGPIDNAVMTVKRSIPLVIKSAIALVRQKDGSGVIKSGKSMLAGVQNTLSIPDVVGKALVNSAYQLTLGNLIETAAPGKAAEDKAERFNRNMAGYIQSAFPTGSLGLIPAPIMSAAALLGNVSLGVKLATEPMAIVRELKQVIAHDSVYDDLAVKGAVSLAVK